MTKPGRWFEDNKWYKDQPRLMGKNFITSSSINQVELLQKEAFDPASSKKN